MASLSFPSFLSCTIDVSFCCDSVVAAGSAEAEALAAGAGCEACCCGDDDDAACGWSWESSLSAKRAIETSLLRDSDFLAGMAD